MNTIKKAGTWALPAALTVIAVAWSVAAIGDLLSSLAHPVFAYGVAVLYDGVWLYALGMEAAHRRQGSSTRLPKTIGWVFLPLTVTILAAHGLLTGDVLAAAVGAVIPVIAKVTVVMAIDRDRTRISPRAQNAIDRGRATTRDRIAVSRAVATARADETKAAADIVKAAREAEAESAAITHAAFEKYTEARDRHAVPDWHAELPGLISDSELEALLSGGVTDDVSALGTGGSGLPGTPSVTRDGHTVPELPREANSRAVALLAAELYATDPPPSKRRFREAMRAEMSARGLTGGWDTIDGLYDREKTLTESTEGDQS